jgi:hypothetical protein
MKARTGVARLAASQREVTLETLLSAILGALAAVSSQAVQDGYGALKALIHRKLGAESGLAEAVAAVEKKPDSAARQQLLREEIEGSAASDDAELRAAAEALLETVRALPEGREAIDRIQVTQNVSGNENVFSGTGNVIVRGSRGSP